MPALSEQQAQLVTYRGGFVANWTVVSRLLDLEARGGTFELLDDGRFRVVPPSLLTPDDLAFLRANRDEARRVVAYQADDSHLFTDSLSEVEKEESANRD